MKRCGSCGASVNVTRIVATGQCPTCGARIQLDEDRGWSFMQKAVFGLVILVTVGALAVMVMRLIA
jgi:hypothetical protein